MGRKYGVARLEHEALFRLRKQYPRKREEFVGPDSVSSAFAPRWCHIEFEGVQTVFGALVLGLEFNLTAMLPTMYLSCCHKIVSLASHLYFLGAPRPLINSTTTWVYRKTTWMA